MNTGQSVIRSTQSLPPDVDAFKLRNAKAIIALRSLGADEYDIRMPETHYLAQRLRDDEVLLGVVFGKFKEESAQYTGRGLLAITDRRILLIDKKPFYTHYDNIKFDIVSGVEYRKAAFAEVVTLNTRLGNITFRTFNSHCAQQFAQVVEDMLCAQGRGWGAS